ncbi:MAG: methyltransferase [Acidobacteriota bacterium]|nr:methyltransferase [Acidobacteriota bacterium]
MTAAPKRRPDSSRLQDLALSFQKSAALMSAVDLGVFTAISQGATSEHEVAAAVSITPTNAERLLTVLRTLGLVVDDEGKLVNAPDAERFLVEGERDYAGPWILFTRPRWNDYGQLTEHLRSGEESRLSRSTRDMTVDGARDYHRATYSVGLGAGRRFARQVDLSGRRLMLDIGGGSGAYSIVATQQWPELEAVVFDLPPVTVVTAEFVDAAGVSDRVRTAAGDFTADPLPAGADIAVMASNLPMYSREIIGSVVAKAFEAIAPGGEMHLIGEIVDDDKAGPMGPALWGLAEAVSHSTGLAHSRADCIGYFESAGFIDVTATEFVRATLTRITGTKPAQEDA